MKKTRTVIVLGMLGLLFFGLNVAQAQGGEAGMGDFLKAMQAMSAGASNAPGVVDFRELKTLLPESLEGFKRTKATGEKNSAMGMTISQAEGRYEQGDGSLEITISDNGGMGGLMAFAQAAWAATEMDSESDTGFERTTRYGNHKAREQYDNESKDGEVEILVGGRFMVKVAGYNVPWATIQAAAKKIDLDKLASLKPAAP